MSGCSGPHSGQQRGELWLPEVALPVAFSDLGWIREAALALALCIQRSLLKEGSYTSHGPCLQRCLMKEEAALAMALHLQQSLMKEEAILPLALYLQQSLLKEGSYTITGPCLQ